MTLPSTPSFIFKDLHAYPKRFASNHDASTVPATTMSGSSLSTRLTSYSLDVSKNLVQPATPMPLYSTPAPLSFPCCCYHYHQIFAHRVSLSLHDRLHTGYLYDLWICHSRNCNLPMTQKQYLTP